MADLRADRLPQDEGRDRRVLDADSRQVRDGDLVGPRPTLRNSFQKLAQRDDVLRRSQAGLDGMVQLSEARRLPPVVDRDDACASENLGRELLLARLVRSDGGDMCAGVEPLGIDERDGRRRRRDHDVGAAHRLFDGAAEPCSEPQLVDFIDEGLRASGDRDATRTVSIDRTSHNASSWNRA